MSHHHHVRHDEQSPNLFNTIQVLVFQVHLQIYLQIVVMRPDIFLLEHSSRPLRQTNAELEIIVVCLSYSFAILSVILSFATQVNPKEPLTTPIGNLLLNITSILISFAALVLAAIRIISLDALAAATIGLLPALGSFRRVKLTQLQLRWSIFRIVYGGTDGIFFFYQLLGSTQTANIKHSHERLQIIFYPYQTALTRRIQRFRRAVRFFSFSASGKHTQTLRRFLEDESCAQKYEVLDSDEFWAGQDITADNQPNDALEPKLVVIRHYASTWFAVEKILAAHRLLTHPSNVYAGNGRSVLKGLSALTEIVLIGDLCRLFFTKNIATEYEMIRNKKNHQLAISFCNETFRETGLDKLWQFTINEREERFPQCAQKRYELFRTLFIVLAFHSKLFTQVKYPWENVHNALRNGANGQPLSVLKRCVRRWLKSYGYDVELNG